MGAVSSRDDHLSSDASYRYNLTDVLFHLEGNIERKRTSLASSIGQNEHASHNEKQSKARRISGAKTKRKVSDVTEEGQACNNSKLRNSEPSEEEEQKRQEYVDGRTREDLKDARRHKREQDSEVIVIDDDDGPACKSRRQDKRQQVALSTREASNTGRSSRKIYYQRPPDIPAHEDDIEVQKALLESIRDSSPCAGRHATEGHESKQR